MRKGMESQYLKMTTAILLKKVTLKLLHTLNKCKKNPIVTKQQISLNASMSKVAIK